MLAAVPVASTFSSCLLLVTVLSLRTQTGPALSGCLRGGWPQWLESEGRRGWMEKGIV